MYISLGDLMTVSPSPTEIVEAYVLESMNGREKGGAIVGKGQIKVVPKSAIDYIVQRKEELIYFTSYGLKDSWKVKGELKVPRFFLSAFHDEYITLESEEQFEQVLDMLGGLAAEYKKSKEVGLTESLMHAEGEITAD
jgi:hypothetical protein